MFEAFLQKVPLFADLPDDDLARLCQMIEEVRLEAGQVLCVEGAVADTVYILYQGELEILKQLEQRQVLIAVRHLPGTLIGETALVEEAIRLATVRASRDSLLLALSRQQMDQLFNLSPVAAKIMLQTFIRRWWETETQVQLNEKMAQLGTFTAGIAHELGNPTSAIQRSTSHLQALWPKATQAYSRLKGLGLSAAQLAKVESLDQAVQALATRPLALDSLTRSDREQHLETWLEVQGVAMPWELAPTLVSLELKDTQLSELAQLFEQKFPALLDWLIASYTLQNLLSEISLGADRIAQIVGALKSYIYLDQAPLQDVDIHSSLDNTLTLLESKLRTEIEIQREYDPHLPKITTYGGELNQVWTHLLDNAIDALAGSGQIILRTRLEDGVVVEIEDNGTGIPSEYLAKIFDPFFTTKPLGKGTGLGLSTAYDIVHKHKGQLSVSSEGGRTVVQVRLPLDATQEAK